MKQPIYKFIYSTLQSHFQTTYYWPHNSKGYILRIDSFDNPAKITYEYNSMLLPEGLDENQCFEKVGNFITNIERKKKLAAL